MESKRPVQFYVVQSNDTINEEGEPILKASVNFDVEDGTPESDYHSFAEYIKIDPMMIARFLEALENLLEHRFPEAKKSAFDWPFFGYMEQHTDEHGDYITYTFEVRKD